MSALYPLRQYASQDSHVNTLVAKEQALERKIAALKREKELLLSDGEIERVAREELGMVQPGEVAFAVAPGGEAQANAPRAAPAARIPNVSEASGRRAWHRRWWDAMVDSLSGMR
jgi:hypothetical protein